MSQFVQRYTIYLAFAVAVQLLQVICMFVGSFASDYYSYAKKDGYALFRYIIVFIDLFTFTILAFAILIEPIFCEACR